MVQLLAEFVPARAICRKIAQEFNCVAPSETLPPFYLRSPKWKPLIDKARDQLAKRITDIGVANKFRRLRILNAEILKARKAYLSGITQCGTKLYKQDRAALAAMLRLAAEEMGELKQQVEVGPVEHIFRVIEAAPEKKR